MKKAKNKYLRKVFNGTIYHAPATCRAKGIISGISRKVPWVLESSIEGEGDRCVILRGLLNQVRLSLVGVYAPNSKQLPFWEELYFQFGGYQELLILLGDFNVAIDTHIDRSGQ